MKNLNSEQKKFVETKGNLILIAGPGTGKTHTLITKFEYLLSQGVEASDILALTFTNKAAAEMDSRLKLTPKPLITTFHGLAYRTLSQQEKEGLITDELEREILIKSALEKLRLKFSIKEAGLMISLAKIGQISDASVELIQIYNQLLEQEGLIDYDDLLLRFQPIKKYKYLFVDEFQDTNKLQYQLLKNIVSPGGQVQVVGDPYQSIYGFRGSDLNLFQKFSIDFQAKTLFLIRTYRSSQKITALANSFYKDRNLKTEVLSEGQIRLIQTPGRFSEARHVVEEIKKEVGGIDLLNAAELGVDAKTDFSGSAILFRSHYLSRVLEQELKKANIPIQKAGAESVWLSEAGQKMIKAAEKEVEANPEMAPIDLLQSLALTPDETRDLSVFLYRFDTISDFLQEYQTLKSNDLIDPKANAVTLLSMHASKGLEFDNVFIIGLEECTFSHQEKEEEKRLFYVAVTRARQKLYFYYSKTPSQILMNLDLSLISRERDEKAYRKKLKKSQIRLF